MKKITLASILIFILISGTIFIGNAISTDAYSTTNNPNIKKENNNSIKYQENNDSIDTTINKPTNNDNSNINTIEHINDLNLNISQLNLNIGASSTDTFTVDEVSKHSKKNDCYLIINNKVYDVSEYIGYHPGGSRTITSRCGKEVTGIFARIHSNRAWDLLKKYKIGTITVDKLDTTPQMLNAIENALKDANPDAEIIKITPKKDFYIAKLILNSKLYEIHINNSGKIIHEEVEDDESDWSIWENDKDD